MFPLMKQTRTAHTNSWNKNEDIRRLHYILIPNVRLSIETERQLEGGMN